MKKKTIIRIQDGYVMRLPEDQANSAVDTGYFAFVRKKKLKSFFNRVAKTARNSQVLNTPEFARDKNNLVKVEDDKVIAYRLRLSKKSLVLATYQRYIVRYV